MTNSTKKGRPRKAKHERKAQLCIRLNPVERAAFERYAADTRRYLAPAIVHLAIERLAQLSDAA